MDGITIPTIVDDVTRAEPELIRCVYFYFEAEELGGNWFLGLGSSPIPFILLGLAGIIFQPVEGDMFEDPAQVDSLFDLLEKFGFHIAMADIWLPRRAVRLSDNQLSRGSLLRIEQRLFQVCVGYRIGEIDLERFEAHLKELEEGVTYSERESKTFIEWSYKQVGQAREMQNRELALPKKKYNE